MELKAYVLYVVGELQAQSRIFQGANGTPAYLISPNNCWMRLSPVYFQIMIERGLLTPAGFSRWILHPNPDRVQRALDSFT